MYLLVFYLEKIKIKQAKCRQQNASYRKVRILFNANSRGGAGSIINRNLHPWKLEVK